MAAACERLVGRLRRGLFERMLIIGEQQPWRGPACEPGDGAGCGCDALSANTQMYLRALAAAAWADGVLNEAECADLREVAWLPGLPAGAVDAELAAARDKEPDTIAPINGRTLHVGDAMCITRDRHFPRRA
jgi:hypothetical protein